MKRRLMAVLMALVMTLSLLPVSAFAADTEPPVDDNLHFEKSAKVNEDGTTTVRMEAWATGTVTATSRSLPLDIVLVLDQSGSMGEWFGNRGTRIDALKSAANNFIAAVARQAESNHVDHRIAVVGFASTVGRNGTYKNTELLSTEKEKNYGTATDADYKNALVSANSNGRVNPRLTTAIRRLSTDGDTYSEYGIDMANRIFEQYPLATGEQRQRVIIMFTDGYTAPYRSDDIDYSMSDRAISNAQTAKSSYNAKVYTVGIFNGADPNANIERGFSYGSREGNAQRVAANRYMHYVSSNYVGVTGLRDTGTRVENSSFYLAASDAEALNNVFTTISDSIKTDTTTLDGSAVIADTVAPNFAMPDNVAAITLKVADYQADGSFSNEQAAPAAVTAAIAGQDISVTGFDFSANWCGFDANQNPHGQKLIIEFTIQNENYGGTQPTNEGASVKDGDGNAIKTAENPVVPVPVKIPEAAAAYTRSKVYDGNPFNVKENIADIVANIVPVDGKNNQFVNLTYEIKQGDTVVGTYTIEAGKTSGSWDTEDELTTGKDVGEYKYSVVVTATDAAKADNSVSVSYEDSVVYTITERPVTFTGESDSREWTGAEQELTGIADSGLLEGDTYEGLTYSAKGTDADSYTGVFTGEVTIRNAAGEDVTANYNVIKTPGVLTITDKTETVTVTFKIVNGTWEDGSRGDKTAEVTLTNGKGTLNADDVPTGMQPDKGYTNGTWDVTPNTEENGITGNVTYTYSYKKIIPASFNPNGYIVKQMTGDEMPNEETFTVNVASLNDGADMNGTATLRTGSTNFVFPEGSSFSISEETIFMVAEDEGSAARVTYDTEPRQLKVTVKLSDDEKSMVVDKVYCSTDGENWREIGTAEQDDKLVITNSYADPAPASFNPNGYIVKQMTGDEMPNEETFTVNVAPLNGGADMNGTATLRTGSTNFVFPEGSSFSISEDTIFMVSENEGNAPRVTYDTEPRQLKVTVKLSDDGTAMVVDKVYYLTDGEKWCEIGTAEQDDKLVITNSYEAEVIPDAITIDLSQYIQKELKLTGDNRFTGATYTASVTPIIDGELGEAKTISVSYAANESGLKTFNGTLTFTESGTYRYEVKENIPANATGYDTSVYELLVVVTAEDGKLVATVGQKLAGDQSGEFTNEPIVFHNTYNTGNAIVIPPERPKLNTDDHYAYVVGYPDGTVRPMGNITRAEVATIFFRLLTDDSRTQFWATTNTYSDVKSGDWFNNAVSTLSNAGIISGYPDGTFRPNAPITRAEMAKVIALFAKLDKSEDRFNDIAGHWAEAYIKLAAGNGWIAGYPDGSFKPQQNITRAETMTMINRVLDRVPSVESHLLPYNVMLTFPDCQSGQWYYIAVQEATNSHTYERAVTEKNGDEQWIALRENRDWTEFEY